MKCKHTSAHQRPARLNPLSGISLKDCYWIWEINAFLDVGWGKTKTRNKVFTNFDTRYTQKISKMVIWALQSKKEKVKFQTLKLTGKKAGRKMHLCQIIQLNFGKGSSFWLQEPQSILLCVKNMNRRLPAAIDEAISPTTNQITLMWFWSCIVVNMWK